MMDPFKALLVVVIVGVGAARLFWPQRGLFSWLARASRLTRRVRIEDALKHLYDCEYRQQPGTLYSLSGAMGVSANLAAEIAGDLEQRSLVKLESGSYHLTPEGRSYALRIIRTHRLWERYLSDWTNLDPAEWHREAEQREHRIPLEDAEALAARMGNPCYDPHGDPIPTAGGEIPPPRGRPLTEFAAGELVEIVHVEDEPQVVYAQLLAEGLRPGMRVRVTDVSAHSIRFETYGEEHVLAPVVAANLSAIPLSLGQRVEAPHDTLSILRPGEKGQVVGISMSCRGPQRRRLLDLGIVPGTIVEAELQSPAGDPTGYRVRGAMIALRREQAEMIHVNRLSGGPA
ncbi:MAG: FeoA domain-containing protein [Acidobacteria bacterium]|nr:FeoA domain-containing protein [Acidobacteriota bacterium]